MKPLLARREELLEALRERMPEWQPELNALVDRALKAHEARAEAIARRNRERAQAIADGINRAAGVLPRIDVERWGSVNRTLRRIRQLGPATFGLAAVPDERTVRVALTGKSIPELACTDWWRSACESAISATT